MTARSMPCAICPDCHAYSFQPDVAGRRCNNAAVASAPCQGQWVTRDRFTDWLSCESCNGTGYIDTKRCKECNHTGWIPAR